MYGSFFRSQKHPSKDHDSFREDTSASNTLTENPWDLPTDPQISLPPVQNLRNGNNSVLFSAGEEEEEEQEKPPVEGGGRATILSGSVNLANTIIGAGMLGLPGAFGGTGYVGGSILMILGAGFSSHGLVLLSKAAQQAGLPSSFYTVAKAAVPQYTMLIDLAVTCKCFGVATGYLITVGDCMVDAFDHLLVVPGDDDNHPTNWFISMILSRQFWIVGAVLAVLPVAFYKTLDELKKASALALVFVFFLVFGIVAYANGLADPCLGVDGNDIPDCRGEIVAFTDGPTTLAKLPIFVFAFTCHQNIFPVVNELQQRSQERLNRVVFCSIGFAMLIFFIVALEGYHTFGSNVRGDVLLNLPETEKVTLLRMCIAFMLTLHYPLQLDPSRRCIMSLIHAAKQQYYWRRYNNGNMHRRDSDRNINVLEPASSTEQSFISASLYDDDDDDDDDDAETQQLTRKDDRFAHFMQNDPRQDDLLFYGITVAFLLLSFTTAMIVDDLGVILALVGATGSTLVSYVLPGLIYIKIHPRLDLSKVGAYIQLIMGCLIMPLALYFVLMGKVKH